MDSKEKEYENQWEVMTVIDEVAFALDQKELKKALDVFSEDACLQLVEGDQVVLNAQGKEEIQSKLQQRMEQYDMMFHNNGTRMVTVHTLDQAASAKTKCMARLIGQNPAVDVAECLEYDDKLIKVNGCWYIVSRTIRVLQKSVR